MTNTTPQLLSVQKAAGFLGVNPATIRRWAKIGQLKGIKVGTRGDWRFTQEELKSLTRVPGIKEEQKKFVKIKRLLKQHADEIQQLATEHHKHFLGTSAQFRSEFIIKYQKNHIRIVKEFANNLDKELREGTEIFKQLGETLARDSVRDGLTIEEAVDGIVFLKQAVWQKLDKEGLLNVLTTKDFYDISQAIGTYCDVVASKIAFTYHEYFKQLAKEHDERKDEFISMASHELKTPVTSLKAYMQLMNVQLKRKREGKLVEHLDKMERQVDKLTILIHDLLDLSKMQEGKLEIHKEVFPIDLLIKEVVESLRGTFKTHKIIIDGQISNRVFAYQEIILEEIIDKGIQFVTLHDVKAETPEERVLQAMQGVFHEYERVKIAERMRRGKLYKAKAGVLINGHSLYGYNYIRKTEIMEGGVKQTIPARYEINEEEARVVRMIYSWVGIEGVSLREVIKRLYDQKIPPRKGKSEFWTKGPIVRMLRCDAYVKGMVYYNKSEAVVAKKPIKNDKYKKIKRSSRKPRPQEDWIPFKVPTLIENNGVYEKIQKLLVYNQKYACKRRKYQYLLSGLAACECGSPRVGDGSDGKNYYYRCADRIYKFPLEKECNLPGMNAIVLDEVLWKELVKFLNHPEQLRKYAEDWLRSQTNSDADRLERERLITLISKIAEEQNRYAKAYGEKLLDFDQFKVMMREAGKKKKVNEEQLVQVDTKIAQQGIDTIQLNEIVEEAKKSNSEPRFVQQVSNSKRYNRQSNCERRTGYRSLGSYTSLRRKHGI